MFEIEGAWLIPLHSLFRLTAVDEQCETVIAGDQQCSPGGIRIERKRFSEGDGFAGRRYLAVGGAGSPDPFAGEGHLRRWLSRLFSADNRGIESCGSRSRQLPHRIDELFSGHPACDRSLPLERGFWLGLIRRATASCGLIGFRGSDQVQDGFEIIIGGDKGGCKAVEQVCIRGR